MSFTLLLHPIYTKIELFEKWLSKIGEKKSSYAKINPKKKCGHVVSSFKKKLYVRIKKNSSATPKTTTLPITRHMCELWAKL